MVTRTLSKEMHASRALRESGRWFGSDERNPSHENQRALVCCTIAGAVIVVTLYHLVTKDSQSISIAFCVEIVAFPLFYLLQFGHFKEFSIEYGKLKLLRKENDEAEDRLKRMSEEIDELADKLDILGSGVVDMSTAIVELQQQSNDHEIVQQVIVKDMAAKAKATVKAQKTANEALGKANEPSRAV